MTPGWGETLRTFLRIGLLSFGGPAGQIATMHRILVDEKKWLDEPRFLHALNFRMLLPGPEAQQLATYAGWQVHRTAGTLFVLPGFLVMMALAALYAGFHQLPLVQGLFLGLKPAVLAAAGLIGAAYSFRMACSRAAASAISADKPAMTRKAWPPRDSYSRPVSGLINPGATPMATAA